MLINLQKIKEGKWKISKILIYLNEDLYYFQNSKSKRNKFKLDYVYFYEWDFNHKVFIIFIIEDKLYKSKI